jgi:signal transduction histidine kinase
LFKHYLQFLKVLKKVVSKSFLINALSNKALLVKKICYFTLAILVLQLILGILWGYPNRVFGFILLIALFQVIILWLIRKKYETAAKLTFLSSSYIFIFFLTPIFGYEYNTHLYLVPGVGMALIFFDNEIGNKRWFFALLGIPMWLTIELWAKYWPVVVSVTDEQAELMGQINIGLTMLTSVFMFYVFTSRLNEQLKTIEEEKRNAENSIKRLTQFNNLLTHDLKSPLANIIDIVNLVDEDGLSDEQKELFSLLDNKAKGAHRLVSGITSYFRETQKEPPQWVDTNKLVGEVLSLLTIPPHFNIKVQELPKVFLSEIVIRQLTQNLITNAIKYNDKKQGELNIFFSDDGETGKLCFKDNGVGMTEEQQKNAFELFTLFHKMAQEKSSGMGLAIAKELVESNGGYIEVSSIVGGGSQFNLCFPKAKFKR